MDDDLDDQTLFSKALEDLLIPMELSTFENGVSLMDKLLHCLLLPDMIFLDLNMPLMNGEECLMDIKSEKKLEKIPIIIYSTTFEIHRIEELFRKGAAQYLQKPASFNALKLALKRTLDAIVLGDRTSAIIQPHF